MAAPETVVLLDESGSARTFVMHDAIDVDDEAYFLVEAEDDPEMVLLLRSHDGGLETVTGDEFARVMAVLEAEEAAAGNGVEEAGRGRMATDS